MLRAGDVLIFEDASEQAGTAVALQRRQAVRLTSVEVAQNASAQRVVRVCWGSADALTFSISAERAQVVGNVVLADHGYTLPERESLQAVTPGTRPQLQQGPLTWQAMVLADEDSPVFIPHAWNVPASMWFDEEKALNAFRTGKGIDPKIRSSSGALRLF